MKHSPSTTFRAETPAPTEPGWYYAQVKPNKRKPAGALIEPRLVTRSVTDPSRLVMGSSILTIGDYRWFGPVPEVREG